MSKTRRSITKKRLSCASENIPPGILHMLKDPTKHQMVLQLLSEHTNQIEQNKKMIQKRVCESPTALFRRRALEQQHSPQIAHKTSKSVSKTPTKQQNVSNKEVLKGVVAYVEVEKDGEDNSKKYKDLVQSLGGVVKSTLSKNVTHVVFRGGSYTTYDRAKLVNAHLVSTTWLTACLENNKRMPEKKYPPCSNDLSLTMPNLESPITKEIKETNENSRSSAIKNNFRSSKSSISNESKEHDVITSMSSLRLSNTSGETNSKLSNNSKSSFKSSTSPFSPLKQSCVNSILRKLSDDSSPQEFVTMRKKKNGEKVEEINKSNEDTHKITNIRRKLYCPDDSCHIDYSSEDERQERRLRKLKPNLNINDKVPECVTKAITNVVQESSSSEDSEIVLGNVLTEIIIGNMVTKINTSPKKNKVNNVNQRRRSSEDEQKSLAEFLTRQNNLPTSDSESTPNEKLKKVVLKRKSLPKSQKIDTDSDEDVTPNIKNRNNKNMKRKSLRQSILTKKKSHESEYTPNRMPPKPVSQSENPVRTRRSIRISQKRFNFKELNSSDSQKSSENAESNDEMNVTKQKAVNLIQNNDDKSIKPRKSLRKSVLPKHNVLKSVNVDSETECTPKRKPKPLTSQSEKPSRRSVRISQKTDYVCTSNVNKGTDLQTKSEKSVKPSNVRKQFDSNQNPNKPITFYGLKSESDDLDSPKFRSNKRRSTLDFQSTSSYKAIKIRKINSIKHSSIVCTKMHRNEIDQFVQIVNKLGVFVVDITVNKKTTHLVVGDLGRTLNLLKAMILGCWILKKEWLTESLKAGKWLPEEKYEITDYFPAIQTCRMHRQAFGSPYSMDIFKDCGYIYVDHSTHPSYNELKTLITWCEGKTTNLTRTAQIIVGKLIEQEGAICVTANWILDSITQNMKLPFTDYLIVQSTRRCSIAI